MDNREYLLRTKSIASSSQYHDDIIKWKHFPRYSPFVRGIHRSPVNSPHKGQWRGALMFPLICDWINYWVNNREAGDLRRYRAHYDVTVIQYLSSECHLYRIPSQKIGLQLVKLASIHNNRKLGQNILIFHTIRLATHLCVLTITVLIRPNRLVYQIMSSQIKEKHPGVDVLMSSYVPGTNNDLGVYPISRWPWPVSYLNILRSCGSSIIYPCSTNRILFLIGATWNKDIMFV